MQFSGINGVLYYTPQILEQAGVGFLLSNLGLSSASASILISALVTLLMLPSIGVAMRFMDVAGRRFIPQTLGHSHITYMRAHARAHTH